MEGEADIDAFVDSLFSEAGTGLEARSAWGSGGEDERQRAALHTFANGPPSAVPVPEGPHEAVMRASGAAVYDSPGADDPVVAGPGGGNWDAMPVAQCGLKPPFDAGSLFPFSHLNKMQSIAVPRVLQGGDSLVVAAPTGAGKTVVFEAAIAHAFRDEAASGGRGVAVYVSPIKALAQERCGGPRGSWVPVALMRGERVAGPGTGSGA